MFDPASGDIADPGIASRTVWLDAFTLNIDRTPRNANLLVCREKLWLIDHGASLYFHHHWPAAGEKIRSPFPAIRDHILLPWATELPAARAHAQGQLTGDRLQEVIALAPDDWLVREGEELTAEQARQGYQQFFTERLKHSVLFEEEIVRARS